MSRNQAYTKYDYDDDVDDYDDDDYAEDVHEDQLSPEDRGTPPTIMAQSRKKADRNAAQMTAATAEVVAALGDQASKVKTQQIQDALWHYYYDVDKSVAYLKTTFIPPPSQKSHKKEPTANNGDGKLSSCFILSSLLSISTVWGVNLVQRTNSLGGPPGRGEQCG
jgi:elongation factor 1 alpha-like protein